MSCPNCGLPDGKHYNLCYNSPHYYSAEQERADEPFYGDDDVSERYMEHCPRHGAYAGDCGGCEEEYNSLHDDEDDHGQGVVTGIGTPVVFADPDDIPF